MDVWTLLLDLLITLGAALVFGLVAERLGTSAVVGYLLAGVAVGPSAFGLVSDVEDVKKISEIGVAMLLFTIGLEFSYRRLLRQGPLVFLGGTGAIGVPILLAVGLGAAFGMPLSTAVALGAIVSLGSTAVVLRVLRDRNELDTSFGRAAMGILLFQDIAVIVLVLVVTVMGKGGEAGNVAQMVGMQFASALALALGLFLVATFVVPRLLNAKTLAKNRELPIILAICSAGGATWAAHQLGVSPAIGAFLAGMMLADCRWADQIRADVLPLRTLFVTVFFASIGMLADLGWTLANLPLVLGASALVMVGKTAVTFLCIRPFKVGIVDALAASLAISQIGEFSYVLAKVARDGGLLSTELFQLVVAVTLVTILVTPMLASKASPLAWWLAKKLVPRRRLARSSRQARTGEMKGHVILVGFGDAGQAAAEELREAGVQTLVIDLNGQFVDLAARHGHPTVLGDARQADILEHAHLDTASRVLVAVPDQQVARMIISQSKLLAPHVPVVARSRYHVFADELDMVGADQVIDEEKTVGRMLGHAAAYPTAPRYPAEAESDPYHSLR